MSLGLGRQQLAPQHLRVKVNSKVSSTDLCRWGAVSGSCPIAICPTASRFWLAAISPKPSRVWGESEGGQLTYVSGELCLSPNWSNRL